MKRTKRINYHLLGVYIVLTLYTLYTLYPIFLMLATALKGNLEIMQNPVGLPHQIVLDGFRTLFERENFGQYFLNSIFVSVVSSVILMVISLMLAYVLCRYTSKLSNFLYFFFRYSRFVIQNVQGRFSFLHAEIRDHRIKRLHRGGMIGDFAEFVTESTVIQTKIHHSVDHGVPVFQEAFVFGTVNTER